MKTPVSALPADFPHCQDERPVIVPGETYTVFVNEIEVRVMTTFEGAGFDVLTRDETTRKQILNLAWKLYQKGYLRSHGEERFVKG